MLMYLAVSSFLRPKELGWIENISLRRNNHGFAELGGKQAAKNRGAQGRERSDFGGKKR